MVFKKAKSESRGVRLAVFEAGKEAGRLFIYILRNELHREPFAIFEDLFVLPECRGRGLGRALLKRAIKIAKQSGCYKIISYSRHSRKNLHKFYRSLGFKNHGVELRIDLK